MERLSLCLALFLGLSSASEIFFDCESMLPQRIDAQVQDWRDYPVFTQVSKNTYSASEQIEVTLSIRGEVDIRSFMAQMRVAGTTIVRGSWLAEDPIARTHGCGHEADTLVNDDTDTLSRLRVTWVAPHTSSESGNEAVELQVTIMTEDGKYWTTKSPVVLREDEEISVNGDNEEGATNNEDGEIDNNTENGDDEGSYAVDKERDEHGLRQEIEMIKMKEEQLAKAIEAEDKASEGTWSVILERERQEREEEMQKEMYEYEQQKEAEDAARLARIRAEIKDKEEWEAAHPPTKKPSTAKPTTTTPMVPRDENEIDYPGNDQVVKAGNSAATFAATTLTLIASLVLSLL